MVYITDLLNHLIMIISIPHDIYFYKIWKEYRMLNSLVKFLSDFIRKYNNLHSHNMYSKDINLIQKFSISLDFSKHFYNFFEPVFVSYDWPHMIHKINKNYLQWIENKTGSWYHFRIENLIKIIQFPYKNN
jgi:hypothetical protein